MQQERHSEGDVKVDRLLLQQQLHEFQVERDIMRSRGLDYSPRFHTGNGLRMTGSGDNRSSSPTFPLNSRVSGKEKRRRVHAWLGAQIRSEEDTVSHGDAPLLSMPGVSRFPNFPVPEVPAFAAMPNLSTESQTGTASKIESKDATELLRSNSEFLPATGASVQPFQKNVLTVNHLEKYGEARMKYTSNLGSENPGTWGTNDKGLPGDFSGGGDTYCYVYDPLIAKAYTKKYPISSSVNTPPPTSMQNVPRDSAIPKYTPASENFTPSPTMQTLNRLYTSNLTSSQKYPGPYASQQDLFPLPTKYEEYDMRPIKPLDADVKKSLYGETLSDSTTGLKTQPPRPYLRRSHTAGVSYPVPKPGARTREKTKTLTRSETAQAKSSHPTFPLSPRRRRHAKYNLTKERKSKDESQNPQTATRDEDETVENEKVQLEETPRTDSPDEKNTQQLELPVDLKHVKAATKIQAVWKGYKTRRLNPKVVEIRQEVRARRAEQYISVLCHEVQCLKENLDAEKKMRDLQTEAIRYIWSQLRILQKERKNSPEKRKDSNKRKSPDGRRPRSKSSSPRRGKSRGGKKCSPQGSPIGSPRGLKNNNRGNKISHHPVSESSALDFEDGSDSESLPENNNMQKKADVSWKENPDEPIFQSQIIPRQTESEKFIPKHHAADDTDEGRGTLVTDGEGNPAHSSAEDDSPAKPTTVSEKEVTAENLQLKTTIDTLQEQVAQLQEAMLNLSDRILNRNRIEADPDAWDEEDNLKLVTESQEAWTSASPPPKLAESPTKEEIPLSPEPASARGEVQRVSLKNALTTLKSALSEDELWALCEQAGHNIKKAPSKQYLALETTFLRKDGRVDFSESLPQDLELDEMYLAPEVLENSSASSTKSSVFSLSVVLWSAADWEMSADQAPQLSQELESLLVVMSQDDVTQRAEVDDVIRICEDHHAKASANSLCVCSSLFAEVQDALTLAKSGKVNQKKLALEVSKEQEARTKKMFRENVIPDINSGEWRSALKPASERTLSPRPRVEPTPHEKLMTSLSASTPNLRRGPRPRIFTVRDMFLRDPELVQRLNILPGQRRKNMKAMRLVHRRQSPKDSGSPPTSGIPTPPRALRADVSESERKPDGLSSVILRWHPSKIYDKRGQEANEDKVIGYRIYVNGHPKGMVAGAKSRALLEGLRQSTEYRVHVRAVSALGESDPSNTVIAHITSPPTQRHPEPGKAAGEETFPPIDKERSPVSDSPNPRPNSSPTAPPRRPAAPQAKPRLGAVFPKQEVPEATVESPKTSTSCSSDKSSQKSESKKGDDIIDRVLRRYGIQQAANIVPGYASGSTLSPMPIGLRPKSRDSTETNRRSAQSSLLEDMAKSIETTSLSSNASSEKEGVLPPQPPGEVTAKSLKLLAQLKTDLLN